MEQTAIPTQHPSRLFPVPRLMTIIAFVIIGFLLFALGSHIAVRFYASSLFLFYAVVAQMWVAVMLLGVFQTVLMAPLRVINLIKSQHIKEFQRTIEEETKAQEQSFVLKKQMHKGETVALFYIVNFVVQFVSYLTIGRLFLSDLYHTPINPDLLYRFIPYPDYPLSGLWFKLPYLWFSDTINLGMRTLLWVWAIAGIIQALIYLVRYYRREKKQALPKSSPGTTQEKVYRTARRYATGYFLVFMVLSFILIRHFPVGWEIRYFIGDISQPNPRFNLITALVTFGTIVWLSIPKIRKKTELALAAGIDEKIIYQTQRQMFKDNVLTGAIVGAAAYFVTNQIPSAFELSIFTFEVIALLSPFTLDKAILGAYANKNKTQPPPSIPEPMTTVTIPVPQPIKS